MPRKPEPAPKGDLSPKSFAALMKAPARDAMLELVQQANKKYLYWDDFKYRSVPDGVDVADAWRFLKLMRSSGRTNAPVQDVHGHTFSYVLTDEVQRCLHVIDQQAGGPIRASELATSPDARTRYMVSSLMEEAIASSRIEGASTTRRVAKEMLRTGRSPKDTGEQMIANNYKAVVALNALKDEALTPELITYIQAMLTEGTLSDPRDVGRVRQEDDILVHDELGRVLHVPPKATELPRELRRLCDYANDDGPVFVHPVIKAVILHFWLAYLHPFADGNGRTARALFYLFMLKKGYWLFEYLSVSRVILGKRAGYDKAYLYAELDECDLTYFIDFNLHSIEKSLRDLWAYLERKNADDKQISESLRHDPTLNYRQRALVGRALRDSSTTFTVESHRKSHDIAYATARADLLDLVARGYLEQHRQGKAFVFVPVEGLQQRVGAPEG
jgi:Fic family protein